MSTLIDIVSGFRKSICSVGPLGLKITEDGELVDDANLQIGYGFRGIERMLLERSFLVGTAYADRVDYFAPQAGSLAFASAVESLSLIEVPVRGRYIRILLMEMGRISSHLHFLASVSKEVNSLSAYHFCLREREKLNDLFELYCGSRLGFGCIQVGGVKNNISEGLIDKIEGTLSELEMFREELLTLLVDNPLFRSRLQGLAELGIEDIDANNLTGPNARASGVRIDIRFDAKSTLYEDLNIKPLDLSNYRGDAFGRVLIRIDEIWQSSELILETLKKLPEGNHRVELGMNFTPPAGDVYTEIESPRGYFGVYLESNGGVSPVNVRFCTPSYLTLRVVPWLMQKEMVEDIGIILSTLDVSVSEVDR